MVVVHDQKTVVKLASPKVLSSSVVHFDVGDSHAVFSVHEALVNEHLPKLRKRIQNKTSGATPADPIRIPDISEHGFEKVVTFLYTGVLHPDSATPSFTQAALYSVASKTCELDIEPRLLPSSLWLCYDAGAGAFYIKNSGRVASGSMAKKRSELLFKLKQLKSVRIRRPTRTVCVTLHDWPALGSEADFEIQFCDLDKLFDFALLVRILHEPSTASSSSDTLSASDLAISASGYSVHKPNVPVSVSLRDPTLRSQDNKRAQIAELVEIYKAARKLGCSASMVQVVRSFEELKLVEEEGLRLELAIRILVGYDVNLTTGLLSHAWLAGCHGMDEERLTKIIKDGIVKHEIKQHLRAELHM